MIIINGINSEIIKKILPKFLKKHKVVGIYKSKYNGVKHKNLSILKKNKKYLDKINQLIKNEKKIIFINFAAKRDQGLVLKFDQKKFLDNFKKSIVVPVKIDTTGSQIIYYKE